MNHNTSGAMFFLNPMQVNKSNEFFGKFFATTITIMAKLLTVRVDDLT